MMTKRVRQNERNVKSIAWFSMNEQNKKVEIDIGDIRVN